MDHGGQQAATIDSFFEKSLFSVLKQHIQLVDDNVHRTWSLSILSTRGAYGIKCYNCTTYDDNCRNATCEVSNGMCMKTIVSYETGKGRTTIIETCLPMNKTMDDVCKEVSWHEGQGSKAKKCLCKVDYCNKATGHQTPIAAVLMMSFFVSDYPNLFPGADFTKAT
uniref:Protein sleepless n=1 Tax=Romanomermis culicivorax TaxID=13658 RepID=A0A915JGQ2_ROMCU